MNPAGGPTIPKENVPALAVCFVMAWFSLFVIGVGMIYAVFPLIVSIVGITLLGWPRWKYLFSRKEKK